MTHVLAIIVLVGLALAEVASFEYTRKVEKAGLKKALPSKGILYYVVGLAFEIAAIWLAVVTL